jgi:DNA-binding transcriptional LysR family regulator
LLPAYSPYPATSALYAVHPYKRFVPPKVKVFIDFLVERFDKNYDWSAHPAETLPAALM